MLPSMLSDNEKSAQLHDVDEVSFYTVSNQWEPMLDRLGVTHRILHCCLR